VIATLSAVNIAYYCLYSIYQYIISASVRLYLDYT